MSSSNAATPLHSATHRFTTAGRYVKLVNTSWLCCWKLPTMRSSRSRTRCGGSSWPSTARPGRLGALERAIEIAVEQSALLTIAAVVARAAPVRRLRPAGCPLLAATLWPRRRARDAAACSRRRATRCRPTSRSPPSCWSAARARAIAELAALRRLRPRCHRPAPVQPPAPPAAAPASPTRCCRAPARRSSRSVPDVRIWRRADANVHDVGLDRGDPHALDRRRARRERRRDGRAARADAARGALRAAPPPAACPTPSRGPRGAGGQRRDGRAARQARHVPRPEPLHDLGLQVRAARGGREGAPPRLAGPRGAARRHRLQRRRADSPSRPSRTPSCCARSATPCARR